MILQVGVKAFLRGKDNKYLLVRRSAQKYGKTKGSWDIVGGRIEPGTQLLENLKREVAEECGLTIISEPKLIAAQDIFPADDRHVVRISYGADVEGEVILDTAENTEYLWLSFAEMKMQSDLDKYVQEILDKKLIF